MKKLLSVLLVAVICATTVFANAKAEAVDEGPITLTFWSMEDYDQNVINAFEAKNPNIKIEMLYLPAADILSKLQTALVTGETPDLSMVSSAWMATIANSGHAVDFSDYMEKSVLKDQVNKNYLDICRMESKTGALCLLPTGYNLSTVFVNKAMADAKGVVPPTTWDEFFAACEKLNDPANNVYGYTIRGGNGNAPVLQEILLAYLGVTSPFDENGKCVISSPEAIAFVEKYLGLYGKYTSEADITATYKEMALNFGSQSAAMFIHSFGSYETNCQALGADGFYMLPFPTAINGKFGAQGDKISAIAMYDSCTGARRDAAWKFLEFFVGQEGQSIHSKDSGQVPSNSMVFTEDWAKADVRFNLANKALNADNAIMFVTAGFIPENGDIENNYVKPAIQSVMMGQLTAAEMCKEWARQLEEAYARYMGK